MILRKIMGMALAAIALSALAAGGARAQTVTVTASGPNPVCLGHSATFSFSATVSGKPAVGAECQLNGPTWSWSVTGMQGTVVTNGSAASITVNVPSDLTTPFTVTGTATATYTTTGTGCGGPFSGTGSASMTPSIACCQ